jgi:hypothetical protein
MEFGGGVLVGEAGENVLDLIMDEKKSLHLPWRLEAFHDPLSSSRGLVRILGPIVEAFMLAVIDAGHDLPLGGSLAAQFVGDQHTRRPQLPFQMLAEQAFGGLLVAPALDENFENEARLINRAPSSGYVATLHEVRPCALSC